MHQRTIIVKCSQYPQLQQLKLLAFLHVRLSSLGSCISHPKHVGFLSVARSIYRPLWFSLRSLGVRLLGHQLFREPGPADMLASKDGDKPPADQLHLGMISTFFLMNFVDEFQMNFWEVDLLRGGEPLWLLHQLLQYVQPLLQRGGEFCERNQSWFKKQKLENDVIFIDLPIPAIKPPDGWLRDLEAYAELWACTLRQELQPRDQVSW